MVDSINDLTGRADCSDAILTHDRPPSWWVYGFAAGLVAIAIVYGSTVTAQLLGVAFGVAFVGVWVWKTRYVVVARAGDEVVLAETGSWSVEAHTIIGRYPAPLGGRLQRNIFGGHWANLGEVRVLMKNSDIDRFLTITARGADQGEWVQAVDYF